MLYIVNAIRDCDINETGVEVAGIFDTREKASMAKRMVEDWMEENEYDNYEVFIYPTNVNHLAWYDIETDIKEGDANMNKRLNAIAMFAEKRDAEIEAKKKQAENREEFLKQTILGWSDRIQELIDTANACLNHGIKFWHNSPNNCNYDGNHFITDGWCHILGFELNPHRPSTITRIGKEGGGSCHFDVYTDGKTVVATGDDRLWALKKFVETFDEFETKFYAYVDKICKSK